MSEAPSGSWDSPHLENFARPAGRERRTAGESSANGGGGGGRDAADPDPADVHAWYTTGMELLGKGSPAAAAQVLQRAANAEPASRSVREALARAQFDTGQYAAAADNFRAIVEASPTDDYAHFGLGLSLARGRRPRGRRRVPGPGRGDAPGPQALHRRAPPGPGHAQVPQAAPQP